MAVNSDGRHQFVNGIFSVVILICISILFVSLFRVTVFRYRWQCAEENLRKNSIVNAVKNIQLAAEWLPARFFVSDLIRFNNLRGDISLREAEISPDMGVFLEKLLQAKKYYSKAAELDPLNIDTFTGLARCVSSIERIFPFVRKKPYTEKGLTFFRYLLKLMPSNIYARTLFIQYCYKNNLSGELVHILRDTLAIYPTLYFQLKSQPFYTLKMHEMVKNSLLKAVHGKIYPAAAYRALSDLSQVDGDNKSAIGYYQQMMPYWEGDDFSEYYFSLGRLYCGNEQFSEAKMTFFKALKERKEDRLLVRIWHVYRKEKRWEEFVAFIREVKKRNGRSDIAEILSARCLIKMNRYELAISHLQRVSSSRYRAESLFLQARVAELTKNWDEMELKIQKATVLDPDNSAYHLTFSRSLQRQRKWHQAEKEATRAIYFSAGKNPWLYNHRAWIRWNMKDYNGAISDWEQSTEISPQYANFYYNLALAYEKGNNLYEAINKLENALKINPGNRKYLSKKTSLQKRLRIVRINEK